MHVIVVLEVAVTFVEMVDMVAVFHCLVAVALMVSFAMVDVHVLLGMRLTVVQMVHVITMLDGLVTIAGQVLVILGVMVLLFGIVDLAHDWGSDLST